MLFFLKLLLPWCSGLCSLLPPLPVLCLLLIHLLGASSSKVCDLEAGVFQNLALGSLPFSYTFSWAISSTLVFTLSFPAKCTGPRTVPQPLAVCDQAHLAHWTSEADHFSQSPPRYDKIFFSFHHKTISSNCYFLESLSILKRCTIKSKFHLQMFKFSTIFHVQTKMQT